MDIDICNSLAKTKNLNFSLQIKESSKKMFLSGEWDATSALLNKKELIEKNIMIYLI